MSEKEYKCSKCEKNLPHALFHEALYTDRKRQVASRCRECRSDDYHATKYDRNCMACLKPRRLDSNGICNRCNDDAGKRECRKCGEMKLRYFNFYGPRRVCISCYRVTPPSAVLAP